MGNRKDLYKDIIIKPLSAFSEETEEKKEAECRGIEFIGKRNIADYRYIIGVDLASKKTGMCLFELETRKPVYWHDSCFQTYGGSGACTHRQHEKRCDSS